MSGIIWLDHSEAPWVEYVRVLEAKPCLLNQAPTHEALETSDKHRAWNDHVLIYG